MRTILSDAHLYRDTYNAKMNFATNVPSGRATYLGSHECTDTSHYSHCGAVFGESLFGESLFFNIFYAKSEILHAV